MSVNLKTKIETREATCPQWGPKEYKQTIIANRRTKGEVSNKRAFAKN